MTELAGQGITITGRIPCLVKAQAYNASYLSAKERRMAHLLSYDAEDYEGVVEAGRHQRAGPAGGQEVPRGGEPESGSSSGEEASLEEVAAGVVGEGTAVVSEGVVGVVGAHLHSRNGASRHPSPRNGARPSQPMLRQRPGAAGAAAAAQQQQRQQQQVEEQEGELDGSFCYWDHAGEPSSAGIPLEPVLPLPEGLNSISWPPLGSVDGCNDAAGTGGCGGSSKTGSGVA